MEIQFYINNSDDATINKSLTPTTTLYGSLKNPCSVETPSIIVENSGMINGNYCYIPEFNRYYFLNDQTIISNNRVTVSLSVDVLESFKNDILSLNVIIENSTDDHDNYLSSPLWVSKQKTFTDVINFPDGLSESGEFILITAGG